MPAIALSSLSYRLAKNWTQQPVLENLDSTASLEKSMIQLLPLDKLESIASF